MNIDVTDAEPGSVEADLLALATCGSRLEELDLLLGGRLARAAADADPVAVVHLADELAARRLAAVAIDPVDAEGCARRRREPCARTAALVRSPGRSTGRSRSTSWTRSKRWSRVPFGYPIFAATFLERFAGGGPWAHVDMIGPALVDDDRGDAVGRGASGYGVRMLVELTTRLADLAGPAEHT